MTRNDRRKGGGGMRTWDCPLLSSHSKYDTNISGARWPSLLHDPMYFREWSLVHIAVANKTRSSSDNLRIFICDTL